MLDPVEFADKSGRSNLVSQLRLGDLERNNISNLLAFRRGFVVVVSPCLECPAFVFALGGDVYNHRSEQDRQQG